jgi:hypothetical protein
MLAGRINALLLTPADVCAHVAHVAAAVNDLTSLVLQPPPSKRGPTINPKPPAHTAAGTIWQLQQRQEADACVLQLLLAFRALDLLAAFVVYIGVHVCRLVQLQEQLAAGGCCARYLQPAKLQLYCC